MEFDYPPKPAPSELWRVYPDFDHEFTKGYAACARYTMTSPERMYALWGAVLKVVRDGIPGDFVECGVWRGGSMMAAAITLLRLGAADRPLYLYDTFAGMTRPTELDRDFAGTPTMDAWARYQRGEPDPCAVPLHEVRQALLDTGYDPRRLHLVEGPVERTLPSQAPPDIALLRLDTDWYESTRHELIHLYPRLTPGGVLIIDD
jgi:O-methyltransferase